MIKPKNPSDKVKLKIIQDKLTKKHETDLMSSLKSISNQKYGNQRYLSSMVNSDSTAS